jgi:F0F1-type ATP synthase assembly protein I
MAGQHQRPLRILGTLGGLGLVLGVSVALGALVGWYLDGRWGTGPWLTLAGTLLGTGAGLYEVLTALRQYEENSRGASS